MSHPKTVRFLSIYRLLPMVMLFVCAASAPDSMASDASEQHEASGKTEADTSENDWDIESPPGPSFEQPIDVDQGTWISVDVSPDGTQIVFDLLGDLYLMPITGGDGKEGRPSPTKITSGIAWDMQPRFSPDGQWVAFTSDRKGKSKRAGDNIWIIDLNDKTLVQVTDESYRLLSGPAWSPDGDYLIARKHFTSRRSLGAGEIWMYHRSAMATGATSGVQLTKRPNDQKDTNEAIFSRDGKFVYFSQDASPGNIFQYDKDSNKQIYVIKRLDVESGDVESYITGPGGACRPTPSPDGKQIAFVRRVGAQTGLHLFDAKTGAVRLVYDQLERDMQEAWAIHGVYPSFAWTPDGESIVLWAKGKIRRINIANGSATVIPFRIQDSRTVTRRVRSPIDVAPDEFDVRMLRWVQTSPTGRQVTYQALGHIYIRDLPDGEPRRLTSQSKHFEFYPSYSRDGRFITYVSWSDAELGAIRVASTDLDEGQNWKVTDDPGHYASPVFSPDGRTIVFEKSTGGRLTSPLWSREPGIYRVSSRGGAPSKITTKGANPQFASSNDRIFLTQNHSDKDSDNLTLFSISIEGDEKRDHYSSQWASDMRIAPNGKWIAFIERFNVYLAPFISVGDTIRVGPQAKGLPVAKVSEHAGDWVHFSGDSKQLHWCLGPQLFSRPLNDAMKLSTTPPTSETSSDVEPGSEGSDGAENSNATSKIEIGFRHPHAMPSGKLALVGGRIVTMAGKTSDTSSPSDDVLVDGTILIDGNRIVAIGHRDEVEVPDDAIVLDVEGQVILPGFIDTHAHGAQTSGDIHPQRSWVDFARLAFGVTTIHDPSHNTHAIFSASELTKAGRIIAPRTFSTGTILYGATGSFKAEINSLKDAKFHLQRMKAVGAFSVKSYNQPRRDQRQQVVAAARELNMMVVPEGGSTFMHNMTMIVDGHTGIEHTLPVQTAYDDVMDLWRNTEVGYTPTLSVAYGGISGEQYWYEVDDLWLHPRLQQFIPPHVLVPRARRRNKSPLEDYNHMRVAEIARQVVEDGGIVQAGGHGQLNGICTHWEMWSFVQGGMTPLQALRCGTLNGAKYLGLDGDLGSLEVGKLADLVVIEPGFDPTQEIRDSERIHFVVANGRAFDARRMNQLGSSVPRAEFYWEHAGHGGVSINISRGRGCGCQRPW